MGGGDFRASIFNVSSSASALLVPPLPPPHAPPPCLTLSMRWRPLQLCLGAVGPGRAAVSVAAARGGRQPAWRGALRNVWICVYVWIYYDQDVPWVI